MSDLEVLKKLKQRFTATTMMPTLLMFVPRVDVFAIDHNELA